MSGPAPALRRAIALLEKFYESPDLATGRAQVLIDVELPVLRAALDQAECVLDQVEYVEKGLAEWREKALTNARHLAAVQATARVAIGHLQRVLQDNASTTSEQRAQWRRDAEDWLTSIGGGPA